MLRINNQARCLRPHAARWRHVRASTYACIPSHSSHSPGATIRRLVMIRCGVGWSAKQHVDGAYCTCPRSEFMPCYAMPRHAMSRRVTLCRVESTVSSCICNCIRHVKRCIQSPHRTYTQARTHAAVYTRIYTHTTHPHTHTRTRTQ